MKILITGGTGTLGSALVEKYYPTSEIWILSRDESKQKELQREFPDINCLVADICDLSDLEINEKFDFVFHTAASKHIEICELNPVRTLKTNFQGTINVYNKFTFDHFVFFTTDKAVHPINVYGNSKALAEAYLKTKMRDDYVRPVVSIFRWGNVLGSRGSVVPYFYKLVKEGKTIPLTHRGMDRFWITIGQAVEFVELMTTLGDRREVYYPNMRSAKMTAVIDAISFVARKKAKIKVTGMRPGEKLVESIALNELGNEIDTNSVPRFKKSELIEMVRGCL